MTDLGSINVDAAPPSLRSDITDDLGKERELRRLRKRVDELELQTAQSAKMIAPAVRIERNKDHTITKCGVHPQVLVCEDTPRVECAVCGTELDAIEVLRDFANHERQFVYTVQHLRREKDELEKVVEALKKERVKVRGQLRKDGVKGDAALRIEEKARWGR